MTDSVRAAEPRGSSRHPVWGLIAQVLGALGIILAILFIVGAWTGQGWADQAVHDLMRTVDDTASGAVTDVHEVTILLEEQAMSTDNDPDTQAAFAAGAELSRTVEGQLADVQAQAGDVGDALVTTITLTAVVVTALLIYQVLLHGALWTLGRHWRRD
jgi:hypothetical protein